MLFKCGANPTTPATVVKIRASETRCRRKREKLWLSESRAHTGFILNPPACWWRQVEINVAKIVQAITPITGSKDANMLDETLAGAKTRLQSI
jgi:hypothetical protein